ncbi:MAG: cryptochrome/photolyase family protein, partial [Verrucomicrobiaceae bacterium]
MQSVWILGDQLSHWNSALVAAERRGQPVVLMIESKARGGHIRYHQQKLVLIYSAMRHFAEELGRAGWEVDYHRLEETPTFEVAFRRHIAKYQPEGLLLAEPNDFLMAEVARKVGRKFRLGIEFFPTSHFLLPREEFSAWAGTRQWLVMELHYREMRKRTGYLMEADKRPTGGAWNFDFANRHTFREWEKAGRPRSRKAVREEPDAITLEVIAMVEREFA